jgi:hypothetical protein
MPLQNSTACIALYLSSQISDGTRASVTVRAAFDCIWKGAKGGAFAKPGEERGCNAICPVRALRHLYMHRKRPIVLTLSFVVPHLTKLRIGPAKAPCGR